MTRDGYDLEGPGTALEGPQMDVYWKGDSPTGLQRVKENYNRKEERIPFGVINNISKILEISYIRFYLRNEHMSSTTKL